MPLFPSQTSETHPFPMTNSQHYYDMKLKAACSNAQEKLNAAQRDISASDCIYEGLEDNNIVIVENVEEGHHQNESH